MPRILSYIKSDGSFAETNNEGQMVTNFDVVNAGESKKETYTVRNILKNRIKLTPYSKDPELTISVTPNVLDAGATAKVETVFKPNSNRVEPLEARWGFIATVG